MFEGKTLACQMLESCREPVSHIDADGYIYCARHQSARRRYCKVRKLKKEELAELERGNQIKF